MNLPPIALFVYSRLDHTKKTIEALLKNYGAEDYNLIIFSDSAKNFEMESSVLEVRSYIQSIQGFRDIKIIMRQGNYGLAKSITQGVTEILNKFESVIVLEDDLITSPYFLKFMTENLKKFKNCNEVICIHGYVFPIPNLPEVFFLRGADCWGWATWRRGWKIYQPNGEHLLNELKKRKLLKQFDFNGTYPFSLMLEDQIKGKNDSWAIRWYASAFLAEKITLYPGRTLIQNIGFDGTGIHCGKTKHYDTKPSLLPIRFSKIEITTSLEAVSAFESYFRETKKDRFSLIKRIKQYLKKISH